MAGPALSIILTVAAGLAAAIAVLAMIVPAVRRRPVRWKVPVAVLAVSLLTATYGVISLAVWAVRSAPAMAKNAIGTGTAVTLEGLGQTADHFEEKWRKEAVADLAGLQVTATGVTAKQDGDGESQTVTIEMLVTNPTAREIDFGRIVRGSLLLAQDDKGVSWKPRPLYAPDDALPPNTTTRHKLTFEVDRGATLKKLVIVGAAEAQALP